MRLRLVFCVDGWNWLRPCEGSLNFVTPSEEDTLENLSLLAEILS